MGDSTASLLGNSPTASDALSALGGDLTLSISFAVAHELLDAARDAELGEAELIGIVLSTSIVLSALPNVLWLARTEVVAAWAVYKGQRPPIRPNDRSGWRLTRRPTNTEPDRSKHEPNDQTAGDSPARVRVDTFPSRATFG